MKRATRLILLAFGLFLISGSVVTIGYLAATTDWTGGELLRILAFTLSPAWLLGILCVGVAIATRA